MYAVRVPANRNSRNPPACSCDLGIHPPSDTASRTVFLDHKCRFMKDRSVNIDIDWFESINMFIINEDINSINI